MKVNINVAGVTFEGRQDILKKLCACKYKPTIRLRPEPHNTYNSNAVAVTADGIKIGYVPDELCEDVKGCVEGGLVRSVTADIYYSSRIEKYCAGITVDFKED